MSIDQTRPATPERRLTPADVQNARFAHGTMLRPGYNDAEVDRFKRRLAEEMARLHAEKAELRDQVRALQAQVQDAAEAVPAPPSEQAVRILASAQQTADHPVTALHGAGAQARRIARQKDRHRQQAAAARSLPPSVIVHRDAVNARLQADRAKAGRRADRRRAGSP